MAAFAAVVALQRCNQKHGNQNNWQKLLHI
jgi:hypothetical protein